jgi:hypothetical protein
MIKQIFMNLYGTMIPMSGKIAPRDGLIDFLDRHKKKKIIAFSRFSSEISFENLDEAGLFGRFELCSAESMKKFFTSSMIPNKYKATIEDEAKYIGEVVSSGDRRPDVYAMAPPLREIARHTKIPLKYSVMISDNWIDIDDAMCERTQCVFEVPTFENFGTDKFSFDKVKFYSVETFLSGVGREIDVVYGVKLK